MSGFPDTVSSTGRAPLMSGLGTGDLAGEAEAGDSDDSRASWAGLERLSKRSSKSFSGFGVADEGLSPAPALDSGCCA